MARLLTGYDDVEILCGSFGPDFYASGGRACRENS